MHPTINVAVKAARKAGNIIMQSWERRDTITVSEKSKNDYVTNVDKAAEAAIVEIISKAYPEHGFLTEESGGDFDKPYTWIIDPLDGTTNFMRGIPHFAVSIALAHNGRIHHAVVYDPFKRELFTASKGDGAQLDSYRIRVSNQPSIDGALLATGFPFKHKENQNKFNNAFNTLFSSVADMRRAGSAALDLAYVAAGRLDGYWELNVNNWDIAAGALLVQEAGGIVSDVSGAPDFLHASSIVAATPKVFKPIVQAISGA